MYLAFRHLTGYGFRGFVLDKIFIFFTFCLNGGIFIIIWPNVLNKKSIILIFKKKPHHKLNFNQYFVHTDFH